MVEQSLRRLFVGKWNERKAGAPWVDGPESGAALRSLCSSTKTKYTFSADMLRACEKGQLDELDMTNLVAALEAVLVDVSLEAQKKSGTSANIKETEEIKARVNTLREARNSFVHSADAKLSQTQLATIADLVLSSAIPLGASAALLFEALDTDLEQPDLRSDPESAEAKSRGLDLLSQGLLPQALAQFDLAFDESRSISPKNAAFFHIYAAETLLKQDTQESDKKALERAKLACDMLETLWRAHLTKARCYIRAFKLVKAKQALRTALQCPLALKQTFTKEIDKHLDLVKLLEDNEAILAQVGSNGVISKDSHYLLLQAHAIESDEKFSAHRYFEVLQRYAKAASLGSALGSYKTGYVLARGLVDLPRADRAKCVAYFESAAGPPASSLPLAGQLPGVGAAESTYLLSELCHRGLVVARDHDKATSWYEKSRALGGTFSPYPTLPENFPSPKQGVIVQ